MSRGLSYALTASVLFGVSGVVAADAFRSVDPLDMAMFRSLVTAVVLGSVAYRRRATSTGGRLLELAWLGLLLAAVTITYYWAIDRLGVGPGVTVQFLGPVLVLGWVAVVRRVPVEGASWLAALVAVIGTAIVNRVWDLGSADPLGILAGLGAAVSLAGYLLMGERLGRRLPGLTVAAYAFAFSALLWVGVRPPSFPDLSGQVWAQMWWVALGGTAAPFLLMMSALTRLDSGRVGVTATIEPVVASLTAWWLLGQTLSPIQLLGVALVVMGVASIHLRTRTMPAELPAV
jgi:drug/metabolite transporter (DMT)-like permease